jgi:NTP pyrophosphatase (non-canonical NTP hydrolase)
VSDFQTLENDVAQWAEDRGIVERSTPQAQLLKTVSELGELADATVKGDREGVIDGIGDVLVTLIIYARLQGLDITECLGEAYGQIKNRRGKMSDGGVFVKES